MPTNLKPEAQSWVVVSSQSYGPITVDARDKVYSKQKFLIAAGIHQVNLDQQLKVLIENFTQIPLKRNARQSVGTTDKHPDMIAKSSIIHGKMFELTTITYTKSDKKCTMLIPSIRKSKTQD